jgi:hypothetical protein
LVEQENALTITPDRIRNNRSEDLMHAIVRPTRIDIEGANAVEAEVWQPMLDELKAEHVPGQTPSGERMLVFSRGIIIFRINELLDMPDGEVVKILGKHGIEAHVEGDLVKELLANFRCQGRHRIGVMNMDVDRIVDKTSFSANWYRRARSGGDAQTKRATTVAW